MQAVAPVCDVHLDSTDHNAHSTGLDGLWAGVPLLTMPGERFAARVVRAHATLSYLYADVPITQLTQHAACMTVGGIQ